jgi:hypothetical protein
MVFVCFLNLFFKIFKSSLMVLRKINDYTQRAFRTSMVKYAIKLMKEGLEII